MMLSKRKSMSMVAPPKKKRKTALAIEEIAFDPGAREDYLTGFHKRKLQRIKYAKEEAVKKEREEKLTARKILREGRKADLERHVEAVNAMLGEHGGVSSASSEQEDEGEREQWDGIVEEHAVDHEDEYVDEDKFTTITVEAVNVSRDGLHKAAQEGDRDSETSGTERPDGDAKKYLDGEERAGSEKVKRLWTKEPPSGSKKKKKKFRYESKAERKVTRYKERSGNKQKAKARKS